MNENYSRRGVVTVGFDGSMGSHQALVWAASEAARRGAELNIVHAVRPLGAAEAAWLAEAGIALSQARGEVAEHVKDLLKGAEETAHAGQAGLVVRTTAVTGDPREVLLDEASTGELVVVGSRGNGPLRSMLLGSVGAALVRHAVVPVAVIRPRGDRPAARVVVGVEATRDSSMLLRAALAEASWRQAPLTVVSCRWAAEEGYHWVDCVPDDVESDERARAIEGMLAGVRGDYPEVEVDVRHTRGRADRCLIDLAHGVELLVIGRRTSTVLDQIGFGSMACLVVEHARGSVLVVPTASIEEDHGSSMGD
jgi:nucleotide-binding universal stress UspA family protein